MISKVSKFYQSFLNRISQDQNSTTTDSIDQFFENNNYINGYGTLIYQMGNRGFYTLIDENDTVFILINAHEYHQTLKNRKRVQFCLQAYPQISNIYSNGITSRIIAIQLIE